MNNLLKLFYSEGISAKGKTFASGFTKVMCIFLCVVNIGMFPVSAAGTSNKTTVIPLLEVPGVSYEGHTEEIYDNSQYIVNGIVMTASEAYINDLVDVEYVVSDPESISIKRSDKYMNGYSAVFHETGRFTVEMKLTLSDGSKYTDLKYINVEDAPAIESVMSGTHKQERLQVIDFKAAVNPEYPLKEMSVVIENVETSEFADCILSGNITSLDKGTFANSDNIKASPVEIQSETDGSYVYGHIEFVTMYSDDSNMKYSINAVDSRGRGYNFEDNFAVSADKAPIASISMAETFTRDEGTDYASISIEDVSEADGDELSRSWFIKYEGEENYRDISTETEYADNSLGNKTHISFKKKGVGKFYIKLRVTDIWSEGVIEEFVSGTSPKSDETELCAEVVNVAPRVSLGLTETRPAEVIMMGDKRQEDVLDADFENLRYAMLTEGADSVKRKAVSDYAAIDLDDTDGLKTVMNASGAYGYEGNDTAFEENLYLIDNFDLFTVDAVWSNSDSGGRPEEPYTVTSYDADSGNINWKYSFSEDVFQLKYSSLDTHLYQDDESRYLYLVSGGSTMVISKKTGQMISIFDFEMGEYNFCSEDKFFTFRTDGIYGINRQTGKVSKICSGSFYGMAKRVGARIVTYEMKQSGIISKIVFDTENETAKSSSVGKFDETEYCPLGYTYGSERPVMKVNGIDALGNAVLSCTSCISKVTGGSSKTYYAAVHVYDSEGKLLKQTQDSFSNDIEVTAVYNKSGICKYYALTTGGDDSVTAELYGINSSFNKSCTLTDKNGEPTRSENIIYAYEMNGCVYITTGAQCIWIYNSTWGNGPTHGYPERCTTFEFNPATGTALKYSGYLEGCNAYSEYGKNSDFYTAIHTGRNSQYISMASLDNIVTAKSHNLYDVLLRMFSAYMSGDEKNYKAVVIYADGLKGKLDSEESKQLRDMAANRKYSIYVVGSESETGQTLANALDAVFISMNDAYISELAESILGNENSSDNYYASVSVDTDKKGSMQGSYMLEKDTEYFYEIEAAADTVPANTVAITNAVKNQLNDSLYSDYSLYVRGSEIEKFTSAEEKNPFFSYDEFTVSGGMFSGCYVNRNSKSYGLSKDSSEITFNVQPGKKAILSFDYRILKESGMPVNGNYFEIDGNKWTCPENLSASAYLNGNYIYPEILGEGQHKLYMYAAGYGKKFETYTYIDNLKIEYVDSSAGVDDVYDNTENAVMTSNGHCQINGSFTTPGGVTEYRAMKDVEYIAGSPGSAKYTVYDSTSDSDSHSMQINIPSGKTAVAAGIQTHSECYSTYTVIYRWLTGNKAWTCKCGSYNEKDVLNNVTSDWKLYLPAVSGTQSLNTEFNSYRGNLAKFSYVDMYLVNGSNSLIDKQQYVKSTAGGTKTLFLAERGYSGYSSVKLELGTEITGLYSFKLYKIVDGQKVYVEDICFNSEESLSGWKIEGVGISIVSDNSDSEQDESEILVFAKGELVHFDITYWDYEDDPSKRSYWKYTHTPLNDGPNQNAAIILDSQGNVMEERNIVLDAPIERFYIDGMYTVEHWQEDDTGRGVTGGGNSEYDKLSNVVSITFYISGQSDAPWIKYIVTDPQKVSEGEAFGIAVAVDDKDKSVLTLKSEVYCGSSLIFSEIMTDIAPDDTGNYSVITYPEVSSSAESGKYRVICTVSDENGAGFDVYDFYILTEGGIEGMVSHTELWNDNRKKFNLHYFEEECNEFIDFSQYSKRYNEMPRGINIFWPGEALILSADVQGNPQKVYACVDGIDELRCELNFDGEIYRGTLWDESMLEIFDSGVPMLVNVLFYAEYSGGVTKINESGVIMYRGKLYWNIHRTA